MTASKAKRNISALPLAFNEKGVTMLASMFRSESVIKMNIAIVRAFIAMRQVLIGISMQLDDLNEENV